MQKFYFFLTVITMFFSSCIALFDEENFNDQGELKRWLQDETLNVVSIRVFEATRPNRSSPFVTQRDTVIATEGTFFFHKDGSPLRDLTYTKADGTVMQGSWAVGDEGDDDDFHLEIIDMRGLFGADIFHDDMFDLVEWGEDVLRIEQNRLLTRDELKRELEITLKK
ncbi:MAG: hypothetical protein R2879_04675 [Saprospiraceae bacterium]